MMRDKLHHDVEYRKMIAPISGAANDTAIVSSIIDLANVTACEIIITTGVLSDADATFTVLVEDGDSATLTDNAAVADAFLLGTEAGASFVFSDDGKVYKIGYIGPKRYVRLTITPANNTGAWLIGAVAALSGHRAKSLTTQGQ